MSTLCSVVSAASAQLSALLSSLAPREIYYIGGPEPLPAPLTPAEEQSLLARLDTDGAAVRTTLIEHNLRLVVFIARKFDNTGIMLEDLISIGTIGLIKAVNTFDPSKKIKLATYASRCIENEVLMFLRRHSRTRMEVSLDEPLKTDWDGNELLLSDIISSDEESAADKLKQRCEREALMAEIEKLSDRERQIMELRFGLKNGKELTQKEVADRIGISQSYISRLEKKIIKNIKKNLEAYC